jgi:hypothetical protein
MLLYSYNSEDNTILLGPHPLVDSQSSLSDKS